MAILGAFILIVIIGVLTLFCLWDKRECFYLFNFVFKHFFDMENFAFTLWIPVKNLKKPPKRPAVKEDANEEFKKLLCEKIPKKDKIWSDGDKFDIEKFLEEPYLGKVNKITSKYNAKSF